MKTKQPSWKSQFIAEQRARIASDQRLKSFEDRTVRMQKQIEHAAVKYRDANSQLLAIVGKLIQRDGGMVSFPLIALAEVPLLRIKKDKLIGVATVYVGAPGTDETKEQAESLNEY